MKTVYCPKCAKTFQHEITVARAIGLGLGGLAVKQGPVQAILVAAAGYVTGHVIDAILVEYVDPTCPECGLIIREAASIVAH